LIDSHRGKRDRCTTKALFKQFGRWVTAARVGRCRGSASTGETSKPINPGHAEFVLTSYELGESFQFDWSFEYDFVEGMPGDEAS